MNINNFDNRLKKVRLFQFFPIVALVLITSIGISYAWFSANLTGGEDSTSITVGSGTMDITYAGGPSITAINISPKSAAFATKTITITGNSTTDLDMAYKLTLQVQTNTFTANALKWRLASDNSGKNGTIIPAKTTDQNTGTGASAINLGSGNFVSPTEGAKIHAYTLTLFFPETSTNQNVDKGKSFTAYVKIENVN
ncbi:MAG: hypothetical protein PHF21_03015 [Bacilli bacterium]|nr:hypothetical protein [Bacilli bacterium]